MQRRASRTLNFTKAAIDKIAQPDAGRVYHYDEKIPGLAVCVTPAGSKTFYVVGRLARRVEFIRIGRWLAHNETVFDDPVVDTLWVGSELDWFFLDVARDQLKDKAASESIG